VRVFGPDFFPLPSSDVYLPPDLFCRFLSYEMEREPPCRIPQVRERESLPSRFMGSSLLPDARFRGYLLVVSVFFFSELDEFVYFFRVDFSFLSLLPLFCGASDVVPRPVSLLGLFLFVGGLAIPTNFFPLPFLSPPFFYDFVIPSIGGEKELWMPDFPL